LKISQLLPEFPETQKFMPDSIRTGFKKMNIKNRLEKLEANKPTNCFCNKTLLDLWYGENQPLTYCPKCKDKFDKWQAMAVEAGKNENWTSEAI